MPTTFSFVFAEEYSTASAYLCFFCQVEHFGLSAHFEKYTEHASNLSDDINRLYLILLALHCAEHNSQTVTSPQNKKSLQRVHPKSLFYFRLAREWIENLVLIDAKLKVKALRQGVALL